MRRITVAGVTTLGRVATIVTVNNASGDTANHQTGTPAERTMDNNPHGQHDPNNEQTDDYGEHEDDEPDTFPWSDAARWSPETGGDGSDGLSRDRLDELFGEIPDEELGSVGDIGWFGLLRHEDRPGGIVLSQNSYGFRHGWETGSDEALARQWEVLRREYDAFTEATRAYGREAGDRANREPGSWNSGDNDRGRDGSSERENDQNPQQEETSSEHHPEIWVGSLSDYNNGRLHGVWLDATRDPDELLDAIKFMLRNGYDPAAEEWGIFNYDDFCGLSLGEYELLDAVSRVAKGIAEHGEAFAKWVEYVGERSEEALSRFEDHYLGEFESTEAYVEYILEETGAYEFLDFVPDSLKPYVKIDTELLARDTEIELYVAEGHRGGVFVFDTRG